MHLLVFLVQPSSAAAEYFCPINLFSALVDYIQCHYLCSVLFNFVFVFCFVKFMFFDLPFHFFFVTRYT